MEKGQVKVYMSYSVSDFEGFNVLLISEQLSSKPRITDVSTTAGYDRKTWEKYMGEDIERCDVFLLFCTQTSLNSKQIAEECQMAFLLDKIIIPIFINSEDIPEVFHVIPSYQFDKTRDMDTIIEEIYEFISIQAGFTLYEAKNPGSEESLNHLLRNLMSGDSEIESVALVSREGLIVNSILPENVSPMHIAAMSAIILSTCERVLLEFRKGELGVCMIHGTEGIFTCIECGEDFILVAVSNSTTPILPRMMRTSQIIQRWVDFDDNEGDPDNFDIVVFDVNRKYTQESSFFLMLLDEKPSRKKNTLQLIKTAINLYTSQKFSEVIELTDKIIDSDPKAAYAWYLKGCAYINLAKYPRSIFCTNRALDLEPNGANYLNAKGYALHKMRRYSEAIKCYNAAIELDPKNPSYWTYKGMAYRKMRTANIAYECHDKALAINPAYIDAWNNKGIIHDEDGDYIKALECYDKALEIDPNYAIAWHNKSETLIKLYKWEKALRCLDKAIDLQPKSPYSWFLRTDYFYNLGRNEEGRECLLNAMKYITPELLYRIQTSDFSIPSVK